MNEYQKGKERARARAIDWQREFSNQNYSYSEIAYYQDLFYKLARRYGLIREFEENSII